MKEIRFSPAYKIFLNLLNEHKVEYLLVGGFAVRYYGYLRPTKDLDLWVSNSLENGERVLAVCQVFTSGVEELTVEAFLHERRIIRLLIPPCTVEISDPIAGQRPKILSTLKAEESQDIEILTMQSGVNFADCFPKRVVDKLDGLDVNIVSLEDLRIIKQAGNREKDGIDLVNLG